MGLTAPRADGAGRGFPTLFSLACCTMVGLLLAAPRIVRAAVGILALDSTTPTRLDDMRIAAALVGDLVLLPALLAGRAGGGFRPRRPRSGSVVHGDRTAVAPPGGAMPEVASGADEGAEHE